MQFEPRPAKIDLPVMEASAAPSLAPLLLTRFSLRHWRAAPRQSLLLVLILALGIAVFFSIRLANEAALASFERFTGVVAEQSDWILSAPAGSLPESILPELRDAVRDLAARMIPVVETTATRPRRRPEEAIGSRETFQLVGLDLVSLQNFRGDRPLDRSWFNQGGHAGQTARPESGRRAGGGFWEILRDPRTVFISSSLAARDGLAAGDNLRLVINERIVTLRVAGTIPEAEGSPSAPVNLLIMDLPSLQTVAAKEGRLDRIEFILERGPNLESRRLELRDRLNALSRGRWLMGTPADRRASAATMTRAFRLNLTILSMIALLVGLYLIFQALDGAVVRRREEIGILRSLGVEERSIRRAWLIEAAVLGGLGGLVGILLGWAGAQLSVRFVGRTVNALYYATSVDSARLSVTEIVFALLLAVGASLLAGWFPAREASRTPPAQILVRHALAPAGSRLWSNEWLGMAGLGLGWLLTWIPPLHLDGGARLPWAGYLAGGCWIVGGGILGGGLLRLMARGGRPLGDRWVALKLAFSHTVRPSGRHRLAAAVLLCAIAMTAGMAILVSSFDVTMRGWIKRTFQADLYISSDGAQSASTQNRISPATWRDILAHPGVGDADLVQALEVQLPQGRTLLVGAELLFLRQHTQMAWIEAPRSEQVFDPDRNQSLALVSESFSERFRLGRGDHVAVPTTSGPRSLEIAGVFADYGNERGSILVQRRHFAAWFGNEMLSSLILFVKPGFDVAALRAEFLARHPGLSVYTNAYLRQEILRIFRQTFSITYALELIGVAVAVIGLGLTLASILIERRPELTTLRALGLDRRRIARATAVEGGIVGLSGVAGGLLVSVALGWLLIHVINKQTFGWTLQFHLPWNQLGLLALLVVLAGTMVAYGVGRWGADLPADREE
jgi:putative ABC transport system permease protein